MFRLLGLFFIIGCCLRLLWLDSLPVGFTPDEAAFGYNAYSLLLTGRDEWRVPFFSLPYSGLLSFGDDKSPLYGFLAAPSVFFFGLSHFAVRLPNAVFSALAPLAIAVFSFTYFSSFGLVRLARPAAILAALFMSLSTWSVQLSRGAFESHLPLVFLSLSLACFTRRRPVLSALFAALSLYSYHTGRLLSLPLMVAFFVFRPPALPRRHVQVFFSLFFLLALPVLHSALSSPNRRAADVSILSSDDNWLSVVNSRYAAVQSGLPDSIARLFYNRPLAAASQFLSQYSSYFTPQFLFLSGPKETTYGMLPGWGLLPVAFLFTVPLGLYLLRRLFRPFLFLVFFLLAGPTLAALAKGPGFAANRSALMLLPCLLLGSLGLGRLLARRRSLGAILLGVSLLYLLASHFAYFTFGQSHLAAGMNYGYRALFAAVAPAVSTSPQVYVSRSLSEPHIYSAFYLRFPPSLYQRHSPDWRVFTELGFSFLDQLDGYRLGHLTFGSIPKTFSSPALIISRPAELPSAARLLHSVSYPSGEPAVVAGVIYP